MQTKKILTALHIESDEIRLLTTQYFNDSLYVLDTQIVKTDGLSDFNIVDKNALCSAINQAIKNTNEKLNIKIESILLVIPTYRVKIKEETFDVEYPQKHVITSDDIKKIFFKGYNARFSDDYQVVNVYCNEYSVNGITSIKTPIDLTANSLKCKLQIIAVDKIMAYNYAETIEKCGLNILDVCLDSVSLAREMAVFENSYNNYCVSINLEKKHSVFMLTYKGKIIETEMMNVGYNNLSEKLSNSYYLPLRKSDEIIFKFLDPSAESFNKQTTFVWGGKDKINSINDEQLFTTVSKELTDMTNSFKTLCQEIISYPNVSILITGQGANINNLNLYLSKQFNKSVENYIPNMIGVRNPIWTVALGTIYNYIKQDKIMNYASYSASVVEKEIEKEKVSSEDIKEKIKDLIFEDVQEQE